MLILAFIYLGHILLLYSFEHFQKAHFAASILAIIGLFYLPIFNFSVVLWIAMYMIKVKAPLGVWLPAESDTFGFGERREERGERR